MRFEDFSVKEAMLEPTPRTDWPLPMSWVDWEYDPKDPNPTLAVDRDWIPIVLWLPKFLADAGHVSFGCILYTISIISATDGRPDGSRRVWECNKVVPKDGLWGGFNGKECKECIQASERGGFGLHKCGRLACGRAYGIFSPFPFDPSAGLISYMFQSTPAILSKPQLGSCVNYSACALVVSEISLLSERVNETLRCLDPEAHTSHQELAQSLSKAYPHVRARAAIDPILFQGRSIIFNRQTPNHFDTKDPKLGWNPLTVAGAFTGGRLRIRRLGLRMWFGGGACAFVRGAILEHEIEEFDGGQRISIAHFCHDSLWKEMGITLRSSGITE